MAELLENHGSAVLGIAAAPFISVIIPAHNEEKFLARTLTALARQTYPSFETIVVANGCSDGTEAVAQGKCDQLYSLEERSLGRARNLGAQKARGQILLFLDADTLLPPDALKFVARQFTRRYSTGTLKGLPDKRRIAYRLIYACKNFLHRFKLHHGSSGVILVWRDWFLQAGGFDENLYLRENSALMKRLRRFGKYKYISCVPAVTSMRRYDQKGVPEMVWLWLKVWYLSNFSDLSNRTYELMERKPRKGRNRSIRVGLGRKYEMETRPLI